MTKTKQTTKTRQTIKTIPAEETAVFCAETAMLLKAGIPLHEGLAAMTENTATGGAALLNSISEGVEQSGSLYEAARNAGVFPAYMVQMVNIGEIAGKLETVLEALSAFYERESRLKATVRSAVFYPVILILLMAAVIAVLVTAVFPVFSQVIESLGATAGSGGLMRVGIALGNVTLITVFALIALVLVLSFASLFKGGREPLIKIFQKSPVLRKAVRRLASSRFASVVSMMLSSGFELDKTLAMSENVVADRVTKDKIASCRALVSEGTPFSVALLELGLFPGLYARMAQTGEQAGRLDEVMSWLAAKYAEETDEAIASLVSAIEPTLVIVMSVIIGAILLSVMLPLIGVMSLIV
ncbi:MAG: type II secretion system F family protein [Oscillospiraceae bacterium]|jgi:type IV pilus assembly protein PilC|nr:type II secretion system F family protein [Oscillospiraceae bacterium]